MYDHSQVPSNHASQLDELPKPKVLIWVESPHGTGHLGITRRLVDRLVAKGCEVSIASHDLFNKPHNFEFRDCTTLELPPYDTQENREFRKAGMQELLRTVRPQAVITEMWPMGRHDFDGEMKPFVERTKTLGIPTYSVVRPYVAERAGQRSDAETADIIANHFTHVFIRSDENAIPLMQAGRPEFNGRLKDKLVYSGFLADAAQPEEKTQMLFSFGGGWSDEKQDLFDSVIAAATLLASNKAAHPDLAPLGWVIKIPDAVNDVKFRQMQDMVASLGGVDIALERYGRGFQKQLAQSKLSVGFAGQTAMEALVQGAVPVITVMEQPNGDDLGEQDYMKDCLVKRRLAVEYDKDCLHDPACFLERLDAACKLKSPEKSIASGGAGRIADVICGALKARSRAG